MIDNTFWKNLQHNTIYAGIGSRETPQAICTLMQECGSKFAHLGWLLRSGGAQGADTSFELGVDQFVSKLETPPVNALKEIMLPWSLFENNTSPYYRPTKQAYKLAESFHPAWHKLTQGGKALQARNVHQILGLSCESPVDFVLCWTKDGKPSGGTGQALRIAMKHEIPIINLFDTSAVKLLTEFIRNHFQ
jgi:hypothetical protein